MGNPNVETVNGSLRDECLNVHWFETLDGPREIIEAWRRNYNECRPHMGLAETAPCEFSCRAGLLAESAGLGSAENTRSVRPDDSEPFTWGPTYNLQWSDSPHFTPRGAVRVRIGRRQCATPSSS
ncbi:MAG: transposase [Casimicrobiaceae bacterium]